MQWAGFNDAQTGIADFWWCVGKTPEACDVISITHTMLSRGTLTSGLALPVATPLYVTVCARNPGGLQTLSVSDIFQGVFLNLPLLKQVDKESRLELYSLSEIKCWHSDMAYREQILELLI